MALVAEVDAALEAGRGVIVDATFIRRADRDRLARAAHRRRWPCVFVACRADEQVVRARLAAREEGRSVSDARWETYVAQRERSEPFGADEQHVVVDTGGDRATGRAAALRALWRWRRERALPLYAQGARWPPSVSVGAGDALVVTDVQRDFLPGGTLAVAHGDEVIVPLNRYLAEWHARGLPIILTRDWHPPDHCSFQARGGPWPPHCVAGTNGAAFDPRLAAPASAIVLSKATERGREAYSAFEGTDLESRLRAAHVRRVFVGGLATEYCVLATVRDALACGFGAVVLADAIRAIDVHPGDGRRAEEEMVRLGATLVQQPLPGS